MIEKAEKDETVIVPLTVAQEMPQHVQSNEKQPFSIKDDRSLKRKRMRTRNITSSKQQKVLIC